MKKRLDDLPEEAWVFATVYGMTRWDPEIVAKSLRAGTLTRLQAHGLANLLDGSNPKGLRLKMVGQGKGWKPPFEGYQAYERCRKIGQFVSKAIEQGATWEAANLDAAMEFNVSEATVARDVRLFKLIGDLEAD